MTKTEQNWEMWSGDHKDLTYTVTDADSASVDLTSACVWWMLTDESKTASVLLRTADSGCGITISGCTFTVSLSPADTAGLAGAYYNESQVRTSGSVKGTVATGMGTINKDLITS